MIRPAVLAPSARHELREALRWIGDNQPDAAAALADAVQEAAIRIGTNPAIGAHRPKLAHVRFRFWPLPQYRYLIVYTDAADPPRIVRIVRTARDLPRVLSELLE